MSETSEQRDPRTQRLVWIDLEMTGLDPNRERIIEIATLVTDNDLNLVAEGPVIAVHQSDELLAAMDDWNQKTHGESGLVARVKASRVGTAEAERRTLEFLREHVEPGSSPMCGNSVHQDRRFMEREMPDLLAFFHYRNRLDAEGARKALEPGRPGGLQQAQRAPGAGRYPRVASWPTSAPPSCGCRARSATRRSDPAAPGAVSRKLEAGRAALRAWKMWLRARQRSPT